METPKEPYNPADDVSDDGDIEMPDDIPDETSSTIEDNVSKHGVYINHIHIDKVIINFQL
jgi:hypothetical protein